MAVSYAENIENGTEEGNYINVEAKEEHGLFNNSELISLSKDNGNIIPSKTSSENNSSITWKYVYDVEEEEETEEKEEIIIERKSEKEILPPVISEKVLSISERLSLIQEIGSAENEQEALQIKNAYLQRKCLGVLLDSSKMSALEKDLNEALIHSDRRYKQVLEEYFEVKFGTESRLEVLNNAVKDLEDDLLLLETSFIDTYNELLQLEIEATLKLKLLKSRNKLSENQIRSFQEKRKQRFLKLSQVQTTYIENENILKKLENKFLKYVSFGTGETSKVHRKLLLHKQALIEKVEEQKENIRKLQEKYFTYASTLNYLKENCNSVETEIVNNETKWEELKLSQDSLQKQVADLGKKKTLVRKKQYELKENLGILNNPLLIKKYMEAKAMLLKI